MKKLVETCDVCSKSFEIKEKDFNTASNISIIEIGFISRHIGDIPKGETKEICSNCKESAEKEFNIYIKNSKFFNAVDK